MSISLNHVLIPLFLVVLIGGTSFCSADMGATSASIDPESAENWIIMGNYVFDEGYYDDADVLYSWALRVDPANIEAWYRKGNALVELGRTDDALEAYGVALKMDPEYSDAIVAKDNLTSKLTTGAGGVNADAPVAKDNLTSKLSTGAGGVN